MILGGLDLWRRWRERGENAAYYYDLPVRQRVTVGVVYLGLVAVLALAMSVTHVERDSVTARDGRAARRIFRRGQETPAADVSLIAAEFLAGFQLVRKIDRPAVSIFGSARVVGRVGDLRERAGDRAAFADAGFAVVTGGGPGVMAAANRGCKEAGGLSVGFSIDLPLEQGLNDWCDLSLTFDHFHVRKVMFVKAAEGFVIFPGGFGTQDELWEALTLIQTKKIGDFPVVLFDSDYWGEMLAWVRDEMLARRADLAR